MRALLVGAGEVGHHHLTALAATPELEVAGIVEPAPLPHTPAGRVPVFTDYRQALATVRPELVIVATPPRTSLALARQAAATGARVLVEKPVVIDPIELEHDLLDARIAVAFQPHFAPGLAALLAASPKITRARMTLSCRRDASYYRGWRARWATAGGILHQQAIHGLALAARLLPSLTVASCTAEVEHRRHFSDAEDAVRARIGFADGRELLLTGRVDSDAPSRHEVHLTCACGGELSVTGRNLEAGLGPLATAPTHTELRSALYRALITWHHDGQRDIRLFALSELRPLLEMITRVYRTAGKQLRPAA
ncbi:MAG: Gfo/Idh/MocA family oxidoreductase [Pseudonocardiales bacterium]|nr:Gfo/Idh/MocA family oxidoreductase [Pseudonocardiales bacterium]